MLTLIVDFLREGGRLMLLALSWAGIVASALVAVIATAELWKQRRGFASWREIARDDGYFSKEGDPGLLRARGCALGAVRRHALAPWRIVRIDWGRTLCLGAPELINAALRAAIKDWDGALIYVDAVGGSDGLGRDGAVRITPGALGGAAYNPMLAIRRGPHSFGDAQILASALLQSCAPQLVQPFAALILDQLYTAQVHEQNLPALRQRLFNGRQLFEEMAAHLHQQFPPEGVWRCDPEIQRVAQACLADAPGAKAALEAMRKALAPFGDGRLQQTAIGHQIGLGGLVSGDGPQTLIVEAPNADPQMAPFCAALLAQLVATCTEAEKTDHLGRRKQRPILLVIDDVGAVGFVPLLQRRLADARRCGLHICAGAQRLEASCQLLGLKAEEGPHAAAHFEALVVIGPQTSVAAEALSHMGGGFAWFDWLWPQRWRELILPKFRVAYRDFVTAAELERASADKVLIFAGGRRPIWAKAVLQPLGLQSRAIETRDLPDAPHDWMAPPPFASVEGHGTGLDGHRSAHAGSSGAAPSGAGQTSQGELALTITGEVPARVTSSNDLRQALASRQARAKKY